MRPDLSGADLKERSSHVEPQPGGPQRGGPQGRSSAGRTWRSEPSWANLIKADLDWANLEGRTSCGTDLQQGRISAGANLSRSGTLQGDPQGGKSSRSRLYWGRLEQRSLQCRPERRQGSRNRRARGPVHRRHRHFYKSQGKIPEVFLRGCGVPEEFIEFARSIGRNPIEFYSCFISYAHEDKLFARRLHDALQGRGVRCWLDEKQMLPGDDIYEQVDRGIRL